MRKTKIRVTRQDIREGKQEGRYSCPIAIAMKRTIGLRCRVGCKEASVPHFGPLSLPRKAAEFVNTFDYFGAKRVKPFEFYI